MFFASFDPILRREQTKHLWFLGCGGKRRGASLRHETAITLCLRSVLWTMTAAVETWRGPLLFAPFRMPFGHRRTVDSNARARGTRRCFSGKVVPTPAPELICRPDQVVAGSRPSPTRFPLEYPRSRRP